jgi:serine/threonine-protein kinase HipA
VWLKWKRGCPIEPSSGFLLFITTYFFNLHTLQIVSGPHALHGNFSPTASQSIVFATTRRVIPQGRHFLSLDQKLVLRKLTGNGDMHLKNWSFIYPDGKTATLAPACDLVATVPYLPNDNLALKLYKIKAMKDISLELFRKMAGKSKLPEHMVLQTARDTVDATITSWKENYTTFGLPTQLIESIDRHITKGTKMYHGK